MAKVMKATLFVGAIFFSVAQASTFPIVLQPSSIPQNYVGNISIWSASGFDPTQNLQVVFNEITQATEAVSRTAVSVAWANEDYLMASIPKNLTVHPYLVTVEDIGSSTTFGQYSALLWVHDGWRLENITAKPFIPTRFNVAGGTKTMVRVALHPGSKAISQLQPALIRFVDTLSNESLTLSVATSELRAVGGTESLIREFQLTMPTWLVRSDWQLTCSSNDELPTASTPIDLHRACAPDVLTEMSISFDGGLSWGSNPLTVVFGYVKPLRVAFVFTGPVLDFGWTFMQNQGRLALEDDFGVAVDVSRYYENIPEGEFVSRQADKGSTVASGTPVPEFFENEDGTVEKNNYYPLWQILRSLCDEQFDLVFTGSFGFMSQTIDVSSGYAPCGMPTPGRPAPPHTTYMVHLSGYLTNSIVATGFAKIYQMRYLAGLVAGEKLRDQERTGVPIHRGNTCVAYLAAYPLPEVQRGINAFALGCQKMFPGCVVKVLWTGTWHDKDIETAAARYLYHVGQCDIIAQHSDTTEPQLYFSSKGGVGFGYNSDQRSLVGDSVLTSPMFAWKPVYAHFIGQIQRGEWDPKARDPLFGGFGFLQEQIWLGSAEQAVRLAPRMSPKVPAITQSRVALEKTALESAPGIDAFKHIFCGPIKKRWVYRHKSGSSGERYTGCGFQPAWHRLEEPEHLNLRHFRDQQLQSLPANLTSARGGDCLFGLHWPGQALLVTAYPEPFDEDQVFSDYLVEGVELMPPQDHPEFGTIHSEDSHGCFTAIGTTGDRFYKMPTYYEECDGTHWTPRRMACDPKTSTTPLQYEWLEPERKCGTNFTSEGLITVPAELPYVEQGPVCDVVPPDSAGGLFIIIFSTFGAFFCALQTMIAIKYQNSPVFVSNQVRILIFMGVGSVLANLSNLALLGENTPVLCLLRAWMFNVSFTITVSGIWVKIYRLTRIFASQTTYKKLKVKDKDMFKIIGQIVGFDLVLLLGWSILDPPSPTKLEINNFRLVVRGTGEIYRTVCQSQEFSFTAVQLVFKSGLVVTSAINLYRARNAPSKYMARKFVALSCYNIIVFGAITLLVEFGMEYNASLIAKVRVACVSLATSIMMALMVIPHVLIARGVWLSPEHSIVESNIDGSNGTSTMLEPNFTRIASSKTGTQSTAAGVADMRFDISIFKEIPAVKPDQLPKDVDDDEWALEQTVDEDGIGAPEA